MNLSICKTKPTPLDDNDIFDCSSDSSIFLCFYEEKNKDFAFFEIKILLKLLLRYSIEKTFNAVLNEITIDNPIKYI
jgi:hypothetical protein